MLRKFFELHDVWVNYFVMIFFAIMTNFWSIDYIPDTRFFCQVSCKNLLKMRQPQFAKTHNHTYQPSETKLNQTDTRINICEDRNLWTQIFFYLRQISYYYYNNFIWSTVHINKCFFTSFKKEIYNLIHVQLVISNISYF